jgi:MFS family permease
VIRLLQAATRDQRRILAAAQLGWMLDGMDALLYSFALTGIQHEFGMTSAQAGMLSSIPLITGAIGGGVAGYLADRYGRARVLVWSILIYSLFTGLTATARSPFEMGLWRALMGFGLGAEWSAGSVLVAESWPAASRGKAIGFVQSGWALGYILAALLAGSVIPRFGWRALFVCGVLPALVTVWIRRAVPEPPVWARSAQRPDLRMLGTAGVRRPLLVASAVCTSLLFAYWGLFTWIPAYLASPISKGGAGMSVVKSAAWVVPMQIGSFLGYNLFGVFADRFGRRPAFLSFVLSAAALVPVYALAGGNPWVLMALGPLIGFFGHGYFSLFGAMLAEIFPSSIRATAQGISYNAGKAVSAFAPWTIGAIADARGIGAALGTTSAFFVLGAALIFLLPETKGEELA